MEFMGILIGIPRAGVRTRFAVRGAWCTQDIGLDLRPNPCREIGVGAVIWGWPMLQQDTALQELTFEDVPNAAVTRAVPVAILAALPTGFVLDETADVANKIQVTGPDHRIFLFAAGTERSAIQSYMQTQYGAPGTPRAACWTKEPGPWCEHR
jgi:hypothetical protein